MLSMPIQPFDTSLSRVQREFKSYVLMLTKLRIIYRFRHLPNRRMFGIPTPRTLAVYVSIEIQLLRWIIYAYNNPIIDQRGRYVFDFDKLQSEAVKQLIVALRQQQSLKVIAAKAIEALHHLYFPLDSSRTAFYYFAEPLHAFFGILCLTEGGAPQPLDIVPQFCARMQFSMRLCGYHHLYTNYAQVYERKNKFSVSGREHMDGVAGYVHI